jgi:hypothetical protein
MALAMGGVASGSPGGAAALVLMLLAAFWQGARRVSLARSALQPCAAWFRRHLAAHLLAMPAAWWAGLARWVASAAGTARYNEANHEG